MVKRLGKALLMAALVLIVMACIYTAAERQANVAVITPPTVRLSSTAINAQAAEQADTGPVPEAAPEKPAENTPPRVSLGKFRLTAYCPCRKCSGGYGRQTATGARAKEGVTIAADPRVLKYGTKVEIAGVGTRTVQDCGSAVKGKVIDVFVEKHADTYKPEYNRTVEVFLAQ